MPSRLFDSGYEFLLRVGKVAGGVTFIFGIFYGAYQYFEVKKDKQVEQTLLLYRQFNNTPIITYRESIAKALIDNRERIAEAAADEAELEKAIVDIVNQEGIAKHLFLIMDFYDGLVFCIIKNICDAETAFALFHGRSRELYTVFYQYIQLQRRSFAETDFGLGLQTFAEMKKTASRAQGSKALASTFAK